MTYGLNVQCISPRQINVAILSLSKREDMSIIQAVIKNELRTYYPCESVFHVFDLVQ